VPFVVLQSLTTPLPAFAFDDFMHEVVVQVVDEVAGDMVGHGDNEGMVEN